MAKKGAWVSPKVYAILSDSEEGKDIIERLPDMTQEECQSALDEFFGNGGKGYSKAKDYNEAKMNDEREERIFRETGDKESTYDDYEFDEEEEVTDDEDIPTKEKFMEKHKNIINAFEMPKEDGWEKSNHGEKSFIKNKDTDHEMFIQYNGAGYDDVQDWVAGYMENGEYVDKHFTNMEDAKDFLDNANIGELTPQSTSNGNKNSNKTEKYQPIVKKAFNALSAEDAMEIIFSDKEVHKAFQKIQRANPHDSFWYQLSLLPDELYGDE